MNLIKNVVLASVLGSGMCMAQNVQSVTPAIPEYRGKYSEMAE